MIFGFNTDVKYGDSVYHVQSEARVHDQLLQTQVFVKGRCIGKRATSYADQVGHPDFSDAHMQELLKEQHRFLVNAARSGGIEKELEHPTPIKFPEPVAAAPGVAAPARLAAAVAPPPAPPVPASETPGLEMDTAPLEAAEAAPVLEVPQPVRIGPVDAASDVLDSAGLSDLMAAIDANTPKGVVEPVGNPIGSGLDVRCVNPDTAYDGSVAALRILVTQENSPVLDAQVTCRVTVGSTPPARSYSNTLADGTCEVRAEIPASDMESASILVQASFRGKNLSRRFRLVKP